MDSIEVATAIENNLQVTAHTGSLTIVRNINYQSLCTQLITLIYSGLATKSYLSILLRHYLLRKPED